MYRLVSSHERPSEDSRQRPPPARTRPKRDHRGRDRHRGRSLAGDLLPRHRLPRRPLGGAGRGTRPRGWRAHPERRRRDGRPRRPRQPLDGRAGGGGRRVPGQPVPPLPGQSRPLPRAGAGVQPPGGGDLHGAVASSRAARGRDAGAGRRRFRRRQPEPRAAADPLRGGEPARAGHSRSGALPLQPAFRHSRPVRARPDGGRSPAPDAPGGRDSRVRGPGDPVFAGPADAGAVGADQGPGVGRSHRPDRGQLAAGDEAGRLSAPLTVTFAEIDRSCLPLVGGKGANLGELTREGFQVPDGFCVTTEAYELAVRGSQLAPILDRLRAAGPADATTLSRLAEEARQAVLDARVPGSVQQAVRKAYAALAVTEKDVEVAVRSSATAEDLAEASFAGQQDTFLGISGSAAVIDAVRRCWASLWTERAVAYRAANRIDQGSVRLSAVVQRLVPAECSGVLFTADP